MSICIDFWRSRSLKKVANKYNSQALEADALHFSTDIWSSVVVLLGLICASYDLYAADSLAALIVAMIVIYVSYKLGKKSVDVLLDKAPANLIQTVEDILRQEKDVSRFHDLKIRNAGADIFIEVCIHLDPKLSIQEIHQISETIEMHVQEKIDRCTIHIHEEPEERTKSNDK